MQGAPRSGLLGYQRRFLSAPTDRSSSRQPSPAGVDAERFAAVIGARLISMTIDHSDRRHLALAAELVSGEQQSMQQDLDYRLLESTYRQSAEYAAMVQRYPLLRSWITACESSELVGHPPSVGDEQQAA